MKQAIISDILTDQSVAKGIIIEDCPAYTILDIVAINTEFRGADKIGKGKQRFSKEFYDTLVLKE
jgi:hypothetical protein